MIEKRSKDMTYRNNEKIISSSTRSQNSKTSESNHSKIKFLSKKFMHFKIIREDKKKANDTEIGRWTKDEKDKFLEGIALYDTNWKKFTTLIKTRTLIQIRSHAQKFLIKLKNYKNEKLSIDFTLDTVTSIKDMIEQIKSLNRNYNIKNIFRFISNECDRIRKNKKYIGNKLHNIGNNKDMNEEKDIFNRTDIFNKNNDFFNNEMDSSNNTFIFNPFNRIIPLDSLQNQLNHQNLQMNGLNFSYPFFNNFLFNNNLINIDKDEKNRDKNINNNKGTENINNNTNINNNNINNNFISLQNALNVNFLVEELKKQLLINYLKNSNLTNNNLIPNIPTLNSLVSFNFLNTLLMQNRQNNYTNNICNSNYINNNFLSFPLINNTNPNLINNTQNIDNSQNNKPNNIISNNAHSNNNINTNNNINGNSISKDNNINNLVVENDLINNNFNRNITDDLNINNNKNENTNLNIDNNLDTNDNNTLNHNHKIIDINTKKENNHNLVKKAKNKMCYKKLIKFNIIDANRAERKYNMNKFSVTKINSIFDKPEKNIIQKNINLSNNKIDKYNNNINGVEETICKINGNENL